MTKVLGSCYILLFQLHDYFTQRWIVGVRKMKMEPGMG